MEEELKPLHPDVYVYDTKHLAPSLNVALESKSKEDLLSILEPKINGVYAFKCFTNEFCEKLLEELAHLEARFLPFNYRSHCFVTSGLRVKRPNSMNRYGIILDELSFKKLMDDIMEKIISPLASLLFKENNGDNLKYHHAFTVQYKIGEDVQLKKHVDDSDVTLNVCLGKKFEGGQLFFKGLQSSSIQKVSSSLHRFTTDEQIYEISHDIGVGLIHLGKHVHSAKPLTNGERVNLIIWCKANPFR